MALLGITFGGLYGAMPVGKSLAVNPAYVKMLDVETPSTPYFSRTEYEAFGEQSIAKEAIRDCIEHLRKKEGSNATSCSSLPAFAGLERLFGNSDGGGASLHRQLMPCVLELFTGHFEHHDGLLNHILHQDIVAVGREGHPL
jgi:hypothetical protein